MVPSGGTLTFNTHLPWLSTGSINLTAGNTVAGSQVVVMGDLRATGAATIDAPVVLTSSARATLGASDSLTLRGPITYDGFYISSTRGQLGMMRQENSAEALGNTTIYLDRYDWDGASGTQSTTVNSGATLSIGVNHIQDAGADVYRGTLNVNSGRVVVTSNTPWEMAGTVNLRRLPRPPGTPSDPTVPEFGSGNVTITGTLRATNTASITGNVRLIAPTVTLADAADILQLSAQTEIAGGSYTGQGVLSFEYDTTVTADTALDVNARINTFKFNVKPGVTFTTNRQLEWAFSNDLSSAHVINNGSYFVPHGAYLTFNDVDLDGVGENARISVGVPSKLSINAARIDAADNRFDGTIDLAGGSLGMNVASHLWELVGTLNASRAESQTPTISGDTLLLSGTINVLVGETRVEAPLLYAGGTVMVGPTGPFLTTLVTTGTFGSTTAQVLRKTGPGEMYVQGAQSHAAGSILRVEGGTLRLATDAGSPVARNLSIVVGTPGSPATAVLGGAQHLRALNIDNGNVVTLFRLVTESVTIDTTAAARLDLNTGALVVDYAPDAAASPLADIRSYLTAGYHGGAWDGPGVVSSTARATPATRALGYAEAADVLALSGAQTATFLGETVDATSVLVRLTVPGDANLDGAVNFADLLALARNYNKTGAIWSQGDSNYDGVVNFSDLLTLARNYNSALPSAPIPGAPTDFPADLTQVPEPSAALLISAAGGFAFSTRRRRPHPASRSSGPEGDADYPTLDESRCDETLPASS